MSGKPACKVFIVAEGPSEIGDLAKGPQWRPARPREGYFQPMLRKLLGSDVVFAGQKVTLLGRFEDVEKGKVPVHTSRAGKALALASTEEGCRVLVLAHDVDREQGVKRSPLERRRRVAEMHAQIEAGFAAVGGADHVLRIKATPLRMIEAWALGDPEALPAAGGKKGVSLPREPEEAWGDKRDPSSDYPKCILKRVLGCDPTPEHFAGVAERSSVATLRTACPVSFGPFADEAASAAAQLELRPADAPERSTPAPRRRRR